ncbi:MAG: DUF3300 domain-containing protein [Phycisphaerales bacterium]|nr:DUF3300 domain-containing protein [Phycisphaerales bacterium]MCI0630941.1 DUF3300 domain-containing protein [Phycisphaerales bacterium]MCI0675058.1 DUF3300 domain-containing protein [Phycisphaerales bacterium]
MHNRAIAASVLFLALSCTADTRAMMQSPPPATLMSQADLEEMLGPIALYPDTLLANVLAACVYPDEVATADQYIKGGGSVEGIEEQTWEQPVKSIAKVTEALDFLADNIEWTTAVGEVYIAQSKDVMMAVQSLRAKAKTNGALQSSEQMTVVESGSNIVLEPAQPEVIYVPQYNPEVVYVEHHDDDAGDALVGGMIGFGAGLLVGEIFDDDDDWDCDWDDGCVGWGHNDVDINRDTNIERGDVNINVDNSKTNNIGREGQKWEPNKQKVEQRQAQTGGKRASDEFRGVSNQSAAARAKVPTKTSAATTREPAKPLKASNAKPAIATDTDRGNRDLGNTPKPATSTPPARPAPKPSASPRPPTPKTPTAAPKPAARPPTPSAPKPAAGGGGAAKSKPSGFSPNRGSSNASARGASSRGGGGARGGGGGRGGR